MDPEIYELNYDSKTIDIHTNNGECLRKPLKDFLSKEEYQIFQHSSKLHHQQQTRVKKFVKVDKYFLNIRGLILYILGKVNESHYNENEDKAHNYHKQKRLLKNKEKYRKIFPRF